MFRRRESPARHRDNAYKTGQSAPEEVSAFSGLSLCGLSPSSPFSRRLSGRSAGCGKRPPLSPLLLLREHTALKKPERGAARPDSIAFFRKEHLLAGCEAPHAAPPFFLSYRLRSSRLIPRFMRASGSCISSRSHAGKWTAICARGLTPPDEKRLLSTRCRAESHRKAELHPFGPAPSRQRMSGKDIERMGHVCYDRAVARLHGQIR